MVYGLAKKIGDVKIKILKMPQNACHQQSNIKGPQCQNPCKDKLTYKTRGCSTRDIEVLCKEHKRLSRGEICKDKVFKNKAPKNKEKSYKCHTTHKNKKPFSCMKEKKIYAKFLNSI